MKTVTQGIRLATRGHNDVHDITDRIREILLHSGVKNGLVTVFVPGSTAGVTTIEFEEGAVRDLKEAVNRLIPEQLSYEHNARWGDGNGFSHVRAALLGPSLTIPLRDGALLLGTWQQVILVDFDNRSRTRELVVQIMGDAKE